MENQIEEVKQKIDIVTLINEYVPLKKAGRNYKALCPFHPEKTPSFMVSPDRQIFKCFGCSDGGDVFAFIKRADGVEFGDALKKLADRAGVELKEYKPSGLEKRRETIFSINQVAADLYSYLLTKHRAGQAALGYLHSRKIDDSSIKKFQLGFAPEKGDVAVSFLLKKGFPTEDISMAGHGFSTLKARFFDRFKGRVMFPIKDSQGRVTAFSGRALGSREPKYLNSPDTLVFSKSNSLYGVDVAKTEISRQKTAILVEGNLDVISSHQVGVKNVVAPLGTALTEKQIEVLKRFSDTFLIGFDTDFAGDAAAKRGIGLAEEAGFSVRVIDLGEGKDPDELIRKNPGLWKKKIEEATSVYDFILNSSSKKWDPGDAEGKRKISREVLPYIAKLSDEIARDHYVQKIAVGLKVSEEAVRADLKKYLPVSQRGDSSTLSEREQEIGGEISTPSRSSRIDILERYLLALILQTGILLKQLNESFFSQAQTLSLFKIVKKHVEAKGKIKLKALSSQIPESLLHVYDEALLYELGEKILDHPEEAEREVSSCVARIKELNLRSRLRSLSLAIKQAEAASESRKIKALTEQFRDLSLELSHLKTKG